MAEHNVPKKINRHVLKAVCGLTGGHVNRFVPRDEIVEQVKFQIRNLAKVKNEDRVIELSLKNLAEIGLLQQAELNYALPAAVVDPFSPPPSRCPPKKRPHSSEILPTLEEVGVHDSMSGNLIERQRKRMRTNHKKLFKSPVYDNLANGITFPKGHIRDDLLKPDISDTEVGQDSEQFITCFNCGQPTIPVHHIPQLESQNSHEASNKKEQKSETESKIEVLAPTSAYGEAKPSNEADSTYGPQHTVKFEEEQTNCSFCPENKKDYFSECGAKSCCIDDEKPSTSFHSRQALSLQMAKATSGKNLVRNSSTESKTKYEYAKSDVDAKKLLPFTGCSIGPDRILDEFPKSIEGEQTSSSFQLDQVLSSKMTSDKSVIQNASNELSRSEATSSQPDKCGDAKDWPIPVDNLYCSDNKAGGAKFHKRIYDKPMSTLFHSRRVQFAYNAGAKDVKLDSLIASDDCVHTKNRSNFASKHYTGLSYCPDSILNQFPGSSANSHMCMDDGEQPSTSYQSDLLLSSQLDVAVIYKNTKEELEHTDEEDSCTETT